MYDMYDILQNLLNSTNKCNNKFNAIFVSFWIIDLFKILFEA